MKGVRLILLPKQSCIPSSLPAVGDVVVCTFIYEKHRHRSRVICLLIFVVCPLLLYVVVGAYPINIFSGIIFHVRVHPTKLYTLFICTSPADDFEPVLG